MEVKWGIRILMTMERSKSIRDNIISMQNKHLKEQLPNKTRAMIEADFGSKIINEVAEHLANEEPAAKAAVQAPPAKRPRRSSAA